MLKTLNSLIEMNLCNNIGDVVAKALNLTPLTEKEALDLYTNLPASELYLLGDTIRRIHKADNVVTWQIDRNINITNVCVSGCKFCNFHCAPRNPEKAFVTTIDEYKEKIKQAVELGADQILLQGGMHPKFKIEFYEDLFRELKQMFPEVKLHALGPPEVVHIARISRLSIEQTLDRLVAAGLESLPGAGAEILDNDIRRSISPGKCSADKWLEVMRIAHKMNLPTSATMMYGHVESDVHIIRHLLKIRDLQAEVPQGNYGFIAFIPWLFCSAGTALEKEITIADDVRTGYLKIIAISRILLNNVPNIQASWLTLGAELAQLALHCGANDLGSIMIEENVVSSAGATYKMNKEQMVKTIEDAGFTAQLRDQLYNPR